MDQGAIASLCVLGIQIAAYTRLSSNCPGFLPFLRGKYRYISGHQCFILVLANQSSGKFYVPFDAFEGSLYQ